MASRKHCIAVINASVPKNLPIAFTILQAFWKNKFPNAYNLNCGILRISFLFVSGLPSEGQEERCKECQNKEKCRERQV